MTTENLERAFADTRAIVENIKADQLSDPTPCQSWDVRGVLNHVIGGSYYFAGCVNDGKAPASSDILHALLALGYSDREAVAAVKKLPDGLTVGDGIRQALKLLAKA